MKNNFQWIAREDGVKFCMDTEDRRCIDMDVPSGIKTLVLGDLSICDFPVHYISMLQTKKHLKK